MSTYRQRQKNQEKAKPRTTFMSCGYVLILFVAAFFLAGLVMEQVDLYQLTGLRNAEIPLLDIPGSDVPQWVLQILLAVIIVFFLQPLIILVIGFLGGDRKEQIDQTPPDLWRR